ncbi:MAG: reverse transcriptase domain-containing protein [Bacteroidota bacterium]
MAIACYLYGSDGLPEHKDIKYDIDLIDIEAAFLEGKLPKPVYIEFPPGLLETGIITKDESKTKCIKLLNGMYGDPQSALQFFKVYVNHMKEKGGYMQSRMDPSVLYKKNSDGVTTLIAVMHVDDTLLVGTKDAIEDYKTVVKDRFGYTEEGFHKHLGVWYQRLNDENGETIVVASMPDNINGIISTYEDHIGKEVKTSNTPGSPGLSMQKNEDETIDAKMYRRIVGQIMYVVCKILPEASNAARELARHFANPGKLHWVELGKLVGYLKKNREDIKLTYRKPKEMRVVVMSDSNFATNQDDRRSVSGGLHTLGGVLCNWLSKTQGLVTRSSTEAEYVAATLNASELKFMQMFLEEVFFVKTPGLILEDNMACIYLIRNKKVGERTKAIQVRMHWIREAFEKEEFNIDYVKTDQNESDIGTKNVDEKLQSKFSDRLRNGKLRIYQDWENIMKHFEVDGHQNGEAVVLDHGRQSDIPMNQVLSDDDTSRDNDEDLYYPVGDT